MPTRNRFDYIDNSVHQTTDLDRAQKDWYDKVKKDAFGNQDLGRKMFGPKPGDEIKTPIMEEIKEVTDPIKPEIKNNFIPPSDQLGKASLWDGRQIEQDFIVAREDGSNPTPKPADTIVDINRKGTMNDLFSSSLT
jgi:hypothetical protein